MSEFKARTYIVSFEDYWNEKNPHLKKEKAEKTISKEKTQLLPPPETLPLKPPSEELAPPKRPSTSSEVVEKKVIPYRIEETTTEEVFLPEPEVVEEAISEPSVPRKTEEIIEEEEVSEVEEKFFTKEEIKNYLNNMYIIKNKAVAFGKTNADYFHSMTNVEKDILNLSNNYKKINFESNKEDFAFLVYKNNENTPVPPIEELDPELMEDADEGMYDQYERNMDLLIDYNALESSFLNPFYRDKFLLPEDNETNPSNIIKDEDIKISKTKTDDHFLFYWTDDLTKKKANDFLLMKFFFERFGKDGFSKSFKNKKAIQKHIQEKYKGSDLEKAFNEFKDKLNTFWYKKSPDDKKNILFKEWYAPGIESIDIIGREVYREPEIDALQASSFLNGIFALTKWGEIVYIDIFKEFCFGYQMKESDILHESSDKYLNFLIISGKMVGDEFKQKNIIFRPKSYRYAEDEKVNERFMSFTEPFPKVHFISEIEDSFSRNTRIKIGYKKYWEENESAYANYDSIFKNCIESEYLSKSQIDNIKICLPCLSLEKKFPSFTLFEKMNRDEMRELIKFSENCITRDLVAVNDIIALFEFDSTELGGSKESQGGTLKTTRQIKIIMEG